MGNIEGGNNISEGNLEQQKSDIKSFLSEVAEKSSNQKLDSMIDNSDYKNLSEKQKQEKAIDAILKLGGVKYNYLKTGNALPLDVLNRMVDEIEEVNQDTQNSINAIKSSRLEVKGETLDSGLIEINDPKAQLGDLTRGIANSVDNSGDSPTYNVLKKIMTKVKEVHDKLPVSTSDFSYTYSMNKLLFPDPEGLEKESKHGGILNEMSHEYIAQVIFTGVKESLLSQKPEWLPDGYADIIASMISTGVATGAMYMKETQDQAITMSDIPIVSVIDLGNGNTISPTLFLGEGSYRVNAIINNPKALLSQADKFVKYVNIDYTKNKGDPNHKKNEDRFIGEVDLANNYGNIKTSLQRETILARYKNDFFSKEFNNGDTKVDASGFIGAQKIGGTELNKTQHIGKLSGIGGLELGVKQNLITTDDGGKFYTEAKGGVMTSTSGKTGSRLEVGTGYETKDGENNVSLNLEVDNHYLDDKSMLYKDGAGINAKIENIGGSGVDFNAGAFHGSTSVDGYDSFKNGKIEESTSINAGFNKSF